jgi:hypothetical protein
LRLWQRSNRRSRRPKANLRAGDQRTHDGFSLSSQGAVGIECDDVTNYAFPKTLPTDRVQSARIIGKWLQMMRSMPTGREVVVRSKMRRALSRLLPAYSISSTRSPSRLHKHRLRIRLTIRRRTRRL